MRLLDNYNIDLHISSLFFVAKIFGEMYFQDQNRAVGSMDVT